MSKITMTALGALLLTTSLAQAGQSMATSQDGLFVVLATQGGMTEIETSKIAKDRSQNPEVVAFAQRMIDDHTAVGRQVEKAADKANVYIPCELDKGHQMEVDRLEDVSDANFDKTYLMIQDKEHREAAMAFAEEARMGQDPGLMQVAAGGLPIVEEHKKMVLDLENRMGVTPGVLPSMADKPPTTPKA